MRAVSNFLPFIFSLGVLSPSAQQKSNQNTAKYVERTGPFKTWYRWKEIDFLYPSESERQSAIASKRFVPENNLPLGMEVYKDRIFVTFPKWKEGVPVTLAVLPRIPREVSPKFAPYPSWEWQNSGTCQTLTSIFRMQADSCGRLWVLDSGLDEVITQAKQICPPALFIFDLSTDKLLYRYEIPKEFVMQNSLFTNIIVDIRHNECEDTHAYITDVWRYGLIVFSLKKKRSWRVADHLFYPEPLAAAYNLHGLEFEWTDGVFGIALSPVDKPTDDRTLYYHPMSSFREFYTFASIVRNETGWNKIKDAFKPLGQSRGSNGQASASAMDRNGILFYNQVTRDSVGCWDSRKPYKRDNLGVVAKSNETLVFPNDLKVDQEKRQSVWVLSNRLPFYLYRTLNPKEYNFRIMSAYTDDAIRSNICDPNHSYVDTYEEWADDMDCY